MIMGRKSNSADSLQIRDLIDLQVEMVKYVRCEEKEQHLGQLIAQTHAFAGLKWQIVVGLRNGKLIAQLVVKAVRLKCVRFWPLSRIHVHRPLKRNNHRILGYVKSGDLHVLHRAVRKAKWHHRSDSLALCNTSTQILHGIVISQSRGAGSIKRLLHFLKSG